MTLQQPQVYEVVLCNLEIGYVTTTPSWLCAKDLDVVVVKNQLACFVALTIETLII